MAVNRGKQFEEELKKGFFKMGTSVSFDRLLDPQGGQAGVGNICDIIVYHRPFQYYFEAKSTKMGTLNFKGAISDTQWDGLIEKSYIDGVEAGYIVWFIMHNEIYFVPASEMLRLKLSGKVSLSLKDIENGLVENFRVPRTMRKVLPTIHAARFLYELEKDKTIHARRWIPVEC